MIVGFRRTCGDIFPLHIISTNVERVKSYKYLGLHIMDDPTWTLNTICLSMKKKALSILISCKGVYLPTSIHILQGDNREHPEKLFHCLV